MSLDEKLPKGWEIGFCASCENVDDGIRVPIDPDFWLCRKCLAVAMKLLGGNEDETKNLL